MREQTLGTFIDQLAARLPAPGGGAVGALHTAQAAALLAMVARYSDGSAYDAHRTEIDGVVTAADRASARALLLAQEDAAAFTAVTRAYRLPRGTARERAVRSAAVATALEEAAAPPVETVGLAGELVVLAERLVPVGNRHVLGDVGAAAETLRAAAGIACLTVSANLAGITAERPRDRLLAAVEDAEGVMERAAAVAAAVRSAILGGPAGAAPPPAHRVGEPPHVPGL
ncbi:cyclodeaminase/cyclohydrolase family protein [Streptomyces sp. 8L]|uniref:cyclodeaminase/cyclohydrolase family protein n=1 Tax=Streptomyces sp. 8L TaxID=2877242 RepID=UPI001CD4F20B|nr:cyclodeaminase/cyclohydrolase family protein [Streptomyces sp. 8L]MCA1224160.1 cyclodeaminase/cyclohydrolase family protein [Streptomyces sp. 8L]